MAELFVLFDTSLHVMDSSLRDLLDELQSHSCGELLDFDSLMAGDTGIALALAQSGSELVLVNDSSKLCLGKMGETKVCLCLERYCEIRSHQRTKVLTEELPAGF